MEMGSGEANIVLRSAVSRVGFFSALRADISVALLLFAKHLLRPVT